MQAFINQTWPACADPGGIAECPKVVTLTRIHQLFCICHVDTGHGSVQHLKTCRVEINGRTNWQQSNMRSQQVQRLGRQAQPKQFANPFRHEWRL